MKRLIRLTILATATLAPLSAVASGFVWQARGFRVLEETAATNERFLRITDGKGREFEVNCGTNALTATAGERIVRMQELLVDWPGLRLKSLRFFLRPQNVHAVAVPDAFLVDGTDLAVFMPAGMAFYHGTTLRYNFRMLKDAVSMKLLGPFINREEFVSMLLWAIRDPAAFARGSSTSARVDRLEEELANLKKRTVALAEKNLSLEQELALARNAAAFLHNTGFLRGPRPLDQKRVGRLIELKRKTPALTVKEARNILEKEGLELSSTVVELVFYFWFNDFR